MQQHVERDTAQEPGQQTHRDHEIDLLLDHQDDVHRQDGQPIDGQDAARAWHPDTAAMPLADDPASAVDTGTRSRRPFGKATTLILVLLLALIAWMDYSRWIRSDATLAPEPAALAQPAEPSATADAAQADPASVASNPADSLPTAAPSQSASPSVATASAVAPQALPEPTHPELPAIDAAPKATRTPEPGAASLGTVAITGVQDQRLERLESQLARIETLLTQRSPSQAAPAVPAAPAANAVVSATRPQVRPRVPAAKPAAAVKPEEPKIAGQLLSVDLWDGRPSIVVGTGETADQRVRVLQQGDSYNGITLKSIDVAPRRATFDVGQGRLVHLSVEGQ
ncbi:hypothetical protein SAMN05192589_12329 [Paracidovorax valerianellae]|uniref:Uncharacterized protein n=1 Tax=Paracidovorax valerianellae TaxID=187868 RepID=A0A1G7EHQ2_9BURK|nr:hypothetical protein [Paracidovorax valerianellae]SDE63202.1 hypothetical protein SAMN05192589_12329 [Paracidovorax valerianellae]